MLDGREQIRRAYTSSDLALHPPRPRWLPPFLRSNGTNSGSSQPTLNSDTNSSSLTNANNDNNDNGPIYEDARLQVGVMIALPSRYRPRPRHVRCLRESSGAQGQVAAGAPVVARWLRRRRRRTWLFGGSSRDEEDMKGGK